MPAWCRWSTPPAARSGKPRAVSGDAGFCNEDNLAALESRGIAGYLMPGRARHGAKGDVGRRCIRPGSRMAAMAEKLRRAGRRSRYRERKKTAEPVFGQAKETRGFRQFLLRGLEKVQTSYGFRRPAGPEASGRFVVWTIPSPYLGG